jgi:hypothetical protein
MRVVFWDLYFGSSASAALPEDCPYLSGTNLVSLANETNIGCSHGVPFVQEQISGTHQEDFMSAHSYSPNTKLGVINLLMANSNLSRSFKLIVGFSKLTYFDFWRSSSCENWSWAIYAGKHIAAEEFQFRIRCSRDWVVMFVPRGGQWFLKAISSTSLISFHFEIRAKGNGNDMFHSRRMQIESRENTRKIYSYPVEGCFFFPPFLSCSCWSGDEP